MKAKEPEHTEPLNSPASTPSSTRSQRANNVIAIALAIISLSALFVSIYQTKLLAEQQELATKAEKAQLWPRIETNFGGLYGENGYKSVYFALENVGTGPAIIDEFQLFYQAKPCTSWFDLVLKMQAPKEGTIEGLNATNLLPNNRVIKAGDKLAVFRLAPVVEASFIELMQQFEASEAITYKICYSSVFGDTWSVTGPLIRDQIAVEGCPD